MKSLFSLILLFVFAIPMTTTAMREAKHTPTFIVGNHFEVPKPIFESIRLDNLRASEITRISYIDRNAIELSDTSSIVTYGLREREVQLSYHIKAGKKEFKQPNKKSKYNNKLIELDYNKPLYASGGNRWTQRNI